MKSPILAACAAIAFAVGCTTTPALEKDDVIVVAGDSITYHAVALDCGYYHRLTNVFARVCPEKNLTVLPLGFNGAQVNTWRHFLRQTEKQTLMTHVKPGWDVGKALTNKVDALAVFLGMNDILQPSMRDDAASLDKWEADLRSFVGELRARTGARRCVLCTTTPLTADPLSPKNVVRGRMRERLRKVADETGCGVADFGAAVEKTIEDARRLDPRAQPVPDFVHPRALGHWAMARELCRAFGEEKCADALGLGYAAELAALAAKSPKRVSWRLFPTAKDAAAPLGEWRIDWWWNDGTGKCGPAPCAVEPKFPDGSWSVVSCKTSPEGGSLVVRGVAKRLVNEISLVCTKGGASQTATVPIAAAWETSRAWDFPEVWKGQTWLTNAVPKSAEAEALAGPWTRVTPTLDYDGLDAPGACDPYQAFFGAKQDSFWARRIVVSEKEREVAGRFWHKTFSATLGLTLFVNGEKVCAVALNRNGGNRADVPAFRLRKGANEIRVRVDHSNWQRQFGFDLVPLAGDDLSRLEYGAR